MASTARANVNNFASSLGRATTITLANPPNVISPNWPNGTLILGYPATAAYAAVAGYPSISVPFGQFGDITFGGLASVIVVARPNEEAKLLTFARAVEAIGQRVVPSLGETSETMAWQKD